MDRRPHLISVRLGTTDWWVYDEIFQACEYDSVLRAGLTEVGTIVDLGANVGFSVLFWRLMFPTARIIAVEPDPGCARVLLRNCVDDVNVLLIQSGITDRDGVARLVSHQGEWDGRIEDASVATGRQVTTMRMDTLLRKIGSPRVDLLKIDVEGGERRIIETCGSWIMSVRHLIIELHAPYDYAQMRHELAEHARIELLEYKRKNELQEVALLKICDLDRTDGGTCFP